MFVIGRNECIRIVNKENIETNQCSENKPDDVDSGVDIEKEISFLDCLSKALKKFENAEKTANKCLEILTLLYKGWSLKDIAEKTGRTHGATREFFSKCRKKLIFYVKHCFDRNDK